MSVGISPNIKKLNIIPNTGKGHKMEEQFLLDKIYKDKT